MKKGFYLTLNVINVKTIVITVILLTGISLSAVFLSCKTATVFKSVYAEAPLIVIDPGHGGEDGGAQSASGILEKDINLSVSLKLEKILKRHGLKTLMIRTDDKMIYSVGADTVKARKTSDLHNRMEIMKNNPGCLFISIHQNYFGQEKYSGAQVFYRPGHSESEGLASSIQKSIVESLQKKNTRQIKACTSDVYLINKAVSTAVMVECGFLSNKAEAEKLNNNYYQYEMALAIAKGIENYLNTKGS